MQAVDAAAAVDVMERWYDAWNAHDLAAVLDMVTDDVVYEDPGLPAPVARGKEAVRAAFEFHHGYCPDMSLEAHEIWASPGSSTIATWFTFRGTFTGRIEPPGFLGRGQPVVAEGMDRSEMRDGLIARHQIFYDGMSTARDLGLLPNRGSALERLMAAAQRTVVHLRRGPASSRRSGAPPG